MEAFSGAVGLGYRHLETDLRVTGDGVLVCLHDPTVDRTTDGSGPVTGLGFDELSNLDAGYRHKGAEGRTFRGRGIRVPTLEEAVLAFPQASFVVDLKTENVVGPLHDLIERLGLHERLIVGSFSDRRLQEFRAASAGRVATSTGATLARSWLVASRVGTGSNGRGVGPSAPPPFAGASCHRPKVDRFGARPRSPGACLDCQQPIRDGTNFSISVSTGSSPTDPMCSRTCSRSEGSGVEAEKGVAGSQVPSQPMIRLAAVLLFAVEVGSGFGTASASASR